MNLNNFTIKSQEVIANAQMIAMNSQQQQIDSLHILKSILDIDRNVVPFLIKKQEGDPKVIAQIVENQIKSLPTVQGGEIYLSGGAQSAIQKALLFCNELGDEFVSLEHLFFGLFMAMTEHQRY
jgi:ATP-dependent Clp protease ATP-binding subunit ClpB